MVNIRERAGRRQQKPVRRPESRSKRILCLFGIWVRVWRPRGLEGYLELCPYGGQFRTRDSSDSGVLLFVFDGRRLAEADERMISHVFGVHDDKTLEQFNDVASRAERAALMADGHVGYVMPIGGVAAYRNKVSPIGVGVDIGCGNAAIRTDLIAEALVDDLPDLADEIFDTIAFGPGMSNSCDDAPKDDPLFEDPRWAVIPRKYRGNLEGKSRAQLGTTGGGNHYVDVFSDEVGAVWVGVHFGSRALGFNLAHNFVALAQGLDWGDRPDMNAEVLLGLETSLGARLLGGDEPGR